MTHRRGSALTWEPEGPASPAAGGQLDWLRPGERLGSYEIEAKLGEGGVAAVYRGRHVTLGSLYAIKVLKRPRPDLLDRLYQEGRLQASLRHPHVIRVLDILLIQGTLPALVMDFVEGQALSTHLERGSLSLTQRLSLFEQIVEAIAHAHDRGVIHRDIKPSNVLLAQDQAGHLTAYVTDFGVAKHLEPIEPLSSLKTATGHLMGTPYYMSPEQIAGDATIDHRADVFALGVMLYELCCGRRPFTGNSVIEVFRMIQEGRYARVAQLDPSLPTHIDAIIARCLEPSAPQRWGSCHELLTALRRQDDAPGGVAGAGLRAAHEKTPWIVAATFAALGAAALTHALGQQAQLRQSERHATQRERRSQLIEQAWRQAQRQPAHALAMLRAAESLRAGALLPQDAALLRRRGAASQRIPLGSEPTTLSLSPDGRFAATWGIDHRLRVVDLRTGTLAWSRASTERTAAWMVDYSPDGRYLLGYTRAGIVQHGQQLSARQYDARDGEALRTMGHGKGVYGLVMDPEGRWMVTRSEEPQLIVWELATGTPRARLEVGAQMGGACMAFSQDGRHLVAAGDEGELHVFETQTWSRLTPHQVPRARRSLCLLSAAEEPSVIVALLEGALWRLDLATDQLHKIADYHGARPKTLAVRGQRVVIGGDSEPVELLDMASPARHRLEAHDARVMSFEADASRVVTASTDGSVGLWSLSSAELIQRWYGAKSWMLSVKLASDGHIVATTRDGALIRWATDHVQLPSPLHGSPANIHRWWWSGSGRTLLASTDQGALWRWSAAQGFQPLNRQDPSQLLQVTMLADAELALLTSGQGQELLSLEDGSSQRLPQARSSPWARWALGSRRQLYAIHEQIERCEVWQRELGAPHDELIATLSFPCGHIVEDTRGGYIVFGRAGEVFEVHPRHAPQARTLEDVDGIAAIALSETHDVLALARWRGGVRLIERGTLRSIATLTPDAAQGAHRVLASPDGELLATAGLDHRVRLWRAKDGELLHTWAQPEGEVITMRFARGQEALVASTKDRMVWRWSTRGGELEWSTQTSHPLQALRELDGVLVGLDAQLRMWRFTSDAPRRSLLSQTGSWSNLRVCPLSLEVVDVVPYPDADTVWAPASRCAQPLEHEPTP